MFQIDPSWFQTSPWLIILLVVIFVVFLIIAIIWGVRAHHQQALAGREELVGKKAEVLTVIDPKGIIFIQGERWTAISEKGQVNPGEEVTITKVDGLKLWVTKI
ncbi:NfeD family protein [Chloroflexota bacterium]